MSNDTKRDGDSLDDGHHKEADPSQCGHKHLSVRAVLNAEATGGYQALGMTCVDCGTEVTERRPAATGYIQRQTARRLLEGVVRELDKGAQRRATVGESRAATWLHGNAEKVRDALALLVGDVA